MRRFLRTSGSRGRGNAGQLTLEVGGVAGAVLGVVEQGVGVVEDVPLGDGLLAVVGAAMNGV